MPELSATEVDAVEVRVTEHAAGLRHEERRDTAVELQATEVAAVEETAGRGELVELSAPEIDGREGRAEQRDDAFVVGWTRSAVLLGHYVRV